MSRRVSLLPQAGIGCLSLFTTAKRRARSLLVTDAHRLRRTRTAVAAGSLVYVIFIVVFNASPLRAHHAIAFDRSDGNRLRADPDVRYRPVLYGVQ